MRSTFTKKNVPFLLETATYAFVVCDIKGCFPSQHDLPLPLRDRNAFLYLERDHSIATRIQSSALINPCIFFLFTVYTVSASVLPRVYYHCIT